MRSCCGSRRRSRQRNEVGTPGALVGSGAPAHGNAVSFEIRIAGPEALPAFIVLAEEAADWLWARGIHQWQPGSIRAQEVELAHKLRQGWLVAAVRPGVSEPDILAGCLVTRLAPPPWQGRAARGAWAAYLERLVVARAFAGCGLSRAVVEAAAESARRDGRAALRLDCWAGNATLKALFCGLGFREVTELTCEGDRLALFEMDLGGGSPS